MVFFFKIFEFILGAMFGSLFSRKRYQNKYNGLSSIDRVRILEKRRKQRGYRKGWLYHRCEEEGLLDAYRQLFGPDRLIDNDATKFRFGKYKGKYVEDVWESDREYIDWLSNQGWLSQYEEENEMISDLLHLEEENAN
jgi:uncharacterized protein (DUF3820 family)